MTSRPTSKRSPKPKPLSYVVVGILPVYEGETHTAETVPVGFVINGGVAVADILSSIIWHAVYQLHREDAVATSAFLKRYNLGNIEERATS